MQMHDTEHNRTMLGVNVMMEKVSGFDVERVYTHNSYLFLDYQ